MKLLTAAVRGAAGTAAVAYGVNAVPALTAIRPLRIRGLPALAGVGRPDHVALTFDDGPDRASTPHFLELLAGRGVSATFFLLGFMTERNPGLAAELVAAGHEVAVHGYEHVNLLRRTPAATCDDIRRAHDLIGEVSGQAPKYYRPPYGVLTAAAAHTAHKLGLSIVLWTAWGRDWKREATPTSVHQTVRRHLDGGATILLHDSDCTSAPLSWKSALGAVPRLLDECAVLGLAVGRLSAHERRST